MNDIGAIFGCLGVFLALGANIWLIIIIMRGSSVAALLCLFVPFLSLFFIQEHWSEAKPAVFAWFAGLALMIVGFMYAA